MILDSNVTNQGIKNTFSTLEEKLKILHNDKFDYSKVVFKGVHYKVTIICKQCKHEFQQLVASHNRGFGCAKCQAKAASVRNKQSNEAFFEKLFTKYPDFKEKYDYLNKFKGSYEKLKIKCKECDEVFEKLAYQHIEGNGCSCQKRTKLISNKEFFKKLFKNFPENQTLYDYSLTSYTGANNKLKIKCNRCDKVFEQVAFAHNVGAGCSTCNHNFDPVRMYKNQPTILYYIKFNDLFKVGISKKPISQRYCGKFLKEGTKMEILFEKTYKNGLDAFDIEQKTLRDVPMGMILKEDSPLNGGYTELRTFDFFDILSKNIIEYNIKG